MKIPNEVIDAVKEKVHWLKTYQMLSKEHNFRQECVDEANRKLQILEHFLEIAQLGRVRRDSPLDLNCKYAEVAQLVEAPDSESGK